jgi:hypothetical protein
MSAGGSSANVQLGPGRLYVAPLGTTEPTANDSALPSAWRPVGYTEEGSQFSTTLTNSEVEVAEEVDPILYVLSKRANILAVTMAETTRRNLGLALGDMTAAFAANSDAVFEPPTPGEETACMVLWDSHEDPTDEDNVRWLFRQAKPGGTINLPRRKAPAKATIATTFNLEKPPSAEVFKVFPNAAGLI